jgi:biotin carboxylase
MSGEKSCTLVNTRFASALRELGLTNVVWGTPQNTTIHGLRAKIAAGTAIEANQLSYVKYSLTYAAGGQGCLITLYNVWQSRADDFRATADQIILSVRPQ